MATDVEASVAHVDAHKESIVASLSELVAIPSISTLAEHREDIERAAAWLQTHMQSIGLENAQTMQTGGNPVVYADWLHAGPDRPTVLVYGHYDVQPVDPLDEWDTSPFELTARDDYLYARGATDMKAQVVAVLAALAALGKHGGIPLNVKILVEGEEEIGSPHLGDFITANKDLLAADFSLNPDSGMTRADRPSIVYGLRGLAYFELWVHGPAQDLHSGVFGGAVHNPAQVLAELVAGMHDEHGRVTLPGFYDKVRRMSDEERSALAHSSLTDEQIRTMGGNPPALFGEEGFSASERIGARPTLEINGLLAGFTGQGAKTVLPARAMAKISMRLVPHQDPAEVETQLRAYLARRAPESVTWELTEMVHGPAVLVERDSPAVRAAHAALAATFGVEPYYRLEGGSIPVVSLFQDLLQMETVLMGFALPDDAMHAPNERVHAPTFFRGIEAHIRFLASAAHVKK